MTIPWAPAANGATWMAAPPAVPPLVEGIAGPNAALFFLNALVGSVCETASEFLRLLLEGGGSIGFEPMLFTSIK